VVGGRGAYVPKGFEEALPVGDHIFLPRAAPIYDDAREVTRWRSFEVDFKILLPH
jgi:hypothetical protein